MLNSEFGPPRPPVPFNAHLRRLFGRQRRPTSRSQGTARPLNWMWQSGNHAKMAPDPVLLKMRHRRLRLEMLPKPETTPKN